MFSGSMFEYFLLYMHRSLSSIPEMLSGFLTKYSALLVQQEYQFVTVVTLFSGAVLAGIALKLVFVSCITIGFDDYRLAVPRYNVSLTELQERWLSDGGSFAYTPRQNSGSVCVNR